nr:hypothetical protein RMQUEJLB_RMQUEJLB_CDS_0008 [Microvirus sp.]
MVFLRANNKTRRAVHPGHLILMHRLTLTAQLVTFCA